MEPVKSFRVEKVDLEFGSGEKKKVIHFGDLPYKKHQVLLEKIVNIATQRDCLPGVIQALPNTINRELANSNLLPADAIKKFLDSVVEVFSDLDNKQLFSLVELVSNGQLTEKDVEEYAIESAEIFGFIQFAVDRLMVPLKNLHASLSNTRSTK